MNLQEALKYLTIYPKEKIKNALISPNSFFTISDEGLLVDTLGKALTAKTIYQLVLVKEGWYVCQKDQVKLDDTFVYKYGSGEECVVRYVDDDCFLLVSSDGKACQSFTKAQWELASHKDYTKIIGGSK